MEDVFALINQFVNMQLAYRHDERPGESYEALDGKKRRWAWRLTPLASQKALFW